MPDLRALARLLPEATHERLAASLGQHAPRRWGRAAAPRTRSTTSPRVVVPLQALRQFLEDPLQGSARFGLRMRDIEGDDEVPDRDEEPFETERPQRVRLLRQAMLSALAHDRAGDGDQRDDHDDDDREPSFAAVLAHYERLATREELLGRAPTGAFRAAERPGDEAVLRTWWREALEAGGGGRAPYGRVLRFGRAAELEDADDIRGAIVVDTVVGGDPVRVEIVGRTELVVSTGVSADARASAIVPVTGSLVFSCRSPRDDMKVDRELLRAFLDHVALAAAGAGSHTAHTALLAVADERDMAASALERRAFAALGRARALDYLAALAAELLSGDVDAASGVSTGVHAYLLPCEAIFRARRTDRPLTDVIQELREDYLESPFGPTFSSCYGPVPHAVERHDPPAAGDAARMAEARFGLMFDLLVDDAPAGAPQGQAR